MWPAFVALTLLDGLVLHLLPPVGTGVDLVPAILIAVFGNLVLIGALAPWLARRMWARRPAAEPGAPPMAQVEVLIDRIGTGLLVASVVGVLAAGLAARPLVVAETGRPRARRQGDPRRRAREQRQRGADQEHRDRPDGRLTTARSAPASPTTTDATSGATSSIRPSDPVRVQRDPRPIPNGPVD